MSARRCCDGAMTTFPVHCPCKAHQACQRVHCASDGAEKPQTGLSPAQRDSTPQLCALKRVVWLRTRCVEDTRHVCSAA
jgi:hypothetical protein